jgi:PKD repeat protein
VYTTAGNYTITLAATNATGSNTKIRTTYVTIGAPSVLTQNKSICPGGSVVVGTNTYTSANTFTNVLTNQAGCDSTVMTIVTILATSATTQNISLCPGQSVTVGSNTYTSANTYTEVLTNQAVCDSTVITILTLDGSIASTQNIEVC